MDDDASITVAQAAIRLGISRYQVYRRIMRGDLPATKVNSDNVHYEISEKDLAQYIAAGGGRVLSPPRIEVDRDDDTMRVPEVAMLTGFSAEAIRRMCHEGKLPHIKGQGPKGQFRIPRSALAEYVK